MNEAGPLQRGRRNLTGIVSVLVTGTWLAALMTGQDWWLGFMLFGYVVVVPIVAMLFGDEEDVAEWWDDEQVTTGSNQDRDRSRNRDRESANEEDQTDALETLRDRYARGELTDEQFERKVERLLETETLEDAKEQVEREPNRSR